MRFRKLRIAWSVGCAIAAVLLIVLWVRSYWWYDLLAVHPHRPYGLGSYKGELVFACTNFPYSNWALQSKWTAHSYYITAKTPFPLMIDDQPVKTTMGFGWFSFGHSLYVFVPHWFLMLATVPAASIPWIHRKNQFSLRTLLIATTLVAVVLGAIVWAAKS
jgi:hypothetical protein